jgi:hypothetical protein
LIISDNKMLLTDNLSVNNIVQLLVIEIISRAHASLERREGAIYFAARLHNIPSHQSKH